MKRPDHRCHGVPVLRDVCPGRVPIAVHNEDGSLEGVYDLDADLVRGVEHVARKTRTTADAILTELVPAAMRHWRDVRGIS